MQTWLLRHAQTFVGSLGRLAHEPLANLLTVLVIGLALALPACLYLLVHNVQIASSTWSDTLQLAVYLKQDTSASDATQLAERIRKRRDVGAVEIITADAALVEFKKRSGFGQALDALGSNPLPHTLVVHPATQFTAPAAMQTLAVELRALPNVDVVQLDTAWVQRLYAILDMIRHAVSLISALLAIGVIAIVGNTIRLDIQNRRDEIEVTKLVGGSNAFVRRPFLYSGVWYGLGGGVIAWLATLLTISALGGPVHRVAGLYGSTYQLIGLAFTHGLALIGIAVALGWLGSWISTSLHLYRIEPR
jgi:cell division transport system permease protein